MPNDLQAPNWNQTKLDPAQLEGQVAARLETIAKEHNANPSKFMAQLKGGGDTFGIGDMKSSNQMYPEEKAKGPSQSSFLLMGKGRSKKDVRWEQLKSDTDGLGMPKSYKQKLTDSRIVNGGRAKKNHDPFSGGGDRELIAKHNLARQSLGTEGGYVSPQGIKANAHIAMQLGGADLYNTMMDAGRERVAPAEYRALNGAADGNDQLKDAAKMVGDDVKVQFIQKQDDPKPLANLLLSEDESKKIKPPAPQMMTMAPPAPSGLMGDKT